MTLNVVAALADDVTIWTGECVKRARAATSPGLDHTWRMALRAMLRVADAARVTAERQRQLDARTR
jgi:hypothetical protein